MPNGLITVMQNKLEYKKIKTISNIYEFFYKQSNNKISGSEKNFDLEIKVN